MRAIEPEIKRSTILAREQYLAFQAHGGNQNELDDEERKNAEEEVGKKEGAELVPPSSPKSEAGDNKL